VTIETAVIEEAVDVAVIVDVAVSVEVAVTVERRLHRRESEGLVESGNDFDGVSTRCARALSPATGTNILVRSMMGSSESNKRVNPSGTVLPSDGEKGSVCARQVKKTHPRTGQVPRQHSQTVFREQVQP
jgi:hypothetical protein